MGSSEYQGGSSSFLIKFIIAIIIFICLVCYVAGRNADALIVQ